MASVFDGVPALQGMDIRQGLAALMEGLQQRFKNQQDTQERNLLSQIGQTSVNDPEAARQMAFAAGKPELGLKIHELDLNGKKQFAETVQRYVSLATPETWPRLRQRLIEITGEDPGENFEEAKSDILADYGDIDKILSENERAGDNARADEQLNISQEHLRLAQDEAQSGGKPPTGFTRTDAGLTFEVGGPHDPAVIAREAAARGEGRPPRPLPQTAINALTDAGSGFEDFRRLTGTFDDKFGGFVSETAGSIANWAGRNMPGATEERVQTAAWWQDYQTQKNLVRNKLFGSALTVTEKEEFEKANINPGMRPDQIKTNLKRQHDAAQRAARKLANVYIKQGYGADVIEAAIGVPLVDIGLGDLVAKPKAPEGPANPDDVPTDVDPEDWRFLDEDERRQYLEAGQ